MFHVDIVDVEGRFRAGTRDGGVTMAEAEAVASKLEEVLFMGAVKEAEADQSLVQLLGVEHGAVVVEVAPRVMSTPACLSIQHEKACATPK